MSEESNERYWIEIGSATVFVVDSQTGQSQALFTGPDRLLAATAELNRLKEREALGAPDVDITGTFSSEPAQDAGTWSEIDRLNAQAHPTPAAFLAETLPAVARCQRLEGRLARVREVCECADAETMRWTEISTAASALREKLEKELSAEKRFGKPSIELDTPSGPLSATEAAQNAPEVLVDAQIAEGLQSASEALDELFSPYGYGLSKPGPY